MDFAPAMSANDPFLERRASDLAAMRNIAVSMVGYAVTQGGSP